MWIMFSLQYLEIAFEEKLSCWNAPLCDGTDVKKKTHWNLACSAYTYVKENV